MQIDTVTEGMQQTEQQDAEVQQQFYKSNAEGEAFRGLSEVQVSVFSDAYPGMENPVRPMRIRDVPSEMCFQIGDVPAESLPKWLAHYTGQLKPALTAEAFAELSTLSGEAESVAHDKVKLEDVKNRAARFFGQLTLKGRR